MFSDRIKIYINKSVQFYNNQKPNIMGLPNQFNDIIQRDLNVHAAWLPITQNYALGDYGLISDGVFSKLGNISEFNVSFNQSTGPSVSINYKSDVSRVTKFAGGAQVQAIPASAIDAKVTLQFDKAKSFLIKSPTIKVSAIGNVQQVANQLKKANGWRKKWKVIFETYHAEDAVVMSTIDAGTEISFGGNASALESLNLGKTDVNFSIEGNKQMGLDIQGKAGVIALGLFKLKLIGDGPVFLSEEEKKKEVEIEYLNKATLENDL
jgi:hypothetical protein